MQDQINSANSRANQLIAMAESMFGPMSSPWSYEGVTFRDHPPHLYYFPDIASVQISLSLRALGDDLQRDFQLSHEVCHLLYPSNVLGHKESPITNLLNEGISTYFSIYIVLKDHGQEAAEIILESLITHSPNYFKAFETVSKLINRDPSAIKKLRSIQPMINVVNIHDLISAEIGVSNEEAEELTAPFK